MSAIIEGIKKGIEARGMDPAEGAYRAGMKEDALQRSLNGSRKLTALDLVSLCQVLKLDLNDLKE